MADKNPNPQAEQGHRQDGGAIQQERQPTKDTEELSAKVEDSQQQQEFGDLKTANFGSPYYDPFGEEGEEEVEVGGEADHQTTTIEGYSSTGAHRH